jgi:hypothetical protein
MINALVKYILFSGFAAVNLFLQPVFADSLPKVDYSEWSKAAKSLDACEASKYYLPIPELIKRTTIFIQQLRILNASQDQINNMRKQGYLSYEIKGWQSNDCLISISEMQVDCTVSKENLAVLVENAKQIANNTSADQTPGQSTNATVNLILQKSCKKKSP